MWTCSSLSARAPAALFFFGLTIPSAALAIERDAVMAAAASYAEHEWTMTSANEAASCSSSWESDYEPGTHTGVPYAWGGAMGLDDFDQKLTEGDGAGSHSWHGVLGCVAGVDCSGYVSKVWALSARQSTSTMHTVTDEIPLEDVQPGDAFNKAGAHIVLFAGYTAEGDPIIYEAAGGASRVHRTTPGWSYLDGYVPIRYPGITGTYDDGQTATPVVAAEADEAAAAPAPVVAADAPAATQPTTRRVTLQYTTDIGFQAGGDDALSVGPDYLTVGPKGAAAVYDRVNKQVVVLNADSGKVGAFDVGHADALAFAGKGGLAVIDGAAYEVRFYDRAGAMTKRQPLPKETKKGVTLSLDGGIIYTLGEGGEREPVGQVMDGSFVRLQTTVDGGQEAIPLKGKKGSLLRAGGQTLSFPDALQVSGRWLGQWLELEVVEAGAGGALDVSRTLRRDSYIIDLPTATTGAYTPTSDLARSKKEIVYLEPGSSSVDVVWLSE